ncbi:formimidoylglutamase [Psychromonas sp. psych-6C06]|uniref:formimidoylglutamase n=1 Tax=Psychromonas sp. psych-6C06 TaxID=2058089 RepID=UPI000C32A6AF|nr:formimidoylglutamase [Psychromonas sp. psych-6C06]PKF61517.1 formimidoylglutamase [Psychromonas sp. psych-6C06]
MTNKIWTGLTEQGNGAFNLRWHDKVEEYKETSPAGICLFGFPCDLGIRHAKGRSGATKGPEFIRKSLANIAWHLNQDQHVYDAGNLNCEWFDLQKAQRDLANALAHFMRKKHTMMVLGGGHEMAYGNFLALCETEPQDSRIGIINFSSFLGMNQLDKLTSLNPFSQIAEYCQENDREFNYLCLGVNKQYNTQSVFNHARVHHAQYIYDTKMSWLHVEQLEAKIKSFMHHLDALYISFDLSVLPAYVAPGVSFPNAYGVQLDMIEHLIYIIKKHSADKIKISCVAEYNPTYDQDKHTAQIASRLINLIIQ